MQSYQTCWEDEENNREIWFRVDLARDNGATEVLAIIPEKVTFLSQPTGEHHRTIGVHTSKGRQMLVEQYHASGQLEANLANLPAATLANAS